MPELPEVETTRRGLKEYAEGQCIHAMKLYRRDLRWPVSSELPNAALGQRIESLARRGKYLIFNLPKGAMLAHLGMSGSIRIAGCSEQLKKHDHWSLRCSDDQELRFNDPRRFGALFWVADDWRQHPLIAGLGPEPLSEEFSGEGLYGVSRGRKQPIKTLIMDSKNVVGVGNIYASEALFHAGIHPKLASGKLSRVRATVLAEKIKWVLGKAIENGGTTLRDYVNGTGQPGYFQQELWVYGRKGLACKTCGTSIKEIRLGQRSTCFCTHCQKR